MILMMLAVANLAADPAAEMAQLQTRLEAFVSTLSTQSQIQDVESALTTDEGTVDQPCTSVCSRVFQVQGGKAVPFSAMLLQYSTHLNRGNYHYDRPFAADEVLFELDVPPATAGSQCFSQASWNAALVQAGWEPLKPFDETLKVKATADKDAFEKDDDSSAQVVDVPVHGFATRRGDRYLTLLPIAGSYWNAGLMLTPEVQAAEAHGDCLRTVITDRHMAKKGYDAATGAKPTS